MILPIYTHGEQVLLSKGKEIGKEYPNLSELISNMFETMKQANGIGLAAQQIGLDIKLFVVDITDYKSVDDKLENFKKVFINSEILETSEDELISEEGCLSFPGVYFKVKRPSGVKLKYLDEDFNVHEEWFDGLAARCILHEHDHTEGIVFLDHIGPLKKKMIQNKLRDILNKNFHSSFKVKK